MNDRSSRSTFVTVFAVTYAVVYGFTAKLNWPLFTFGPETGEFGWLMTPASAGPTMVYYGWIATAGVSAALVAGLLALRPFGMSQRVWHGLAWVIPVLGMLFFANAMKGYFWFDKLRAGATPSASAPATPPRGIAPAVIAADIAIDIPAKPEH
jgi:hypothetical protein